METKKLIIVDDHRLFREGLKLMLQDYPQFDVVGEADTGIRFLTLLEQLGPPDIVLMDINMPQMNGIEATTNALKQYPHLPVLILSMLGEEDYYNELVGIGVKGFLLKDADPDELVKGIERILEGGHYFSQELLMGILQGKQKRAQQHEQLHLTRREKEVLTYLCQGKTNAEIADALFVSQRTIDRHKSNLFIKSGCNNSVALALFAIRYQLVNLPE